jgi:UDP-N-acetylmuramate dehydrogenase
MLSGSGWERKKKMVGDETWRSELQKRMQGEIRFDEPAERHTSIGVGGKIDALIFPQNLLELRETVSFISAQRVPFMPVGNWTNLIVRSGGYRGILISLACLRHTEIREEHEGCVLLEAGAGVPLSELIQLSVREALTGLEFCAGIPGSVGGAVRMNAGAYGNEIADVCVSLTSAGPAMALNNIMRDALNFTYRNLDLPAETVIIGGIFHLKRGEKEKIVGRIRKNISARRERHPLEYRNAGSIFKNPGEIPAGRLIETSGLRGMRIGDAQVSDKHGNFIVNLGHATATEVLCLIDLIQKRVFEATGYSLETEVRIIGE